MSRAILIIQTWGLGDLIMMLPMIQKLKKTKNTPIELVVSNRGAFEFAKQIIYIDKVYFVERKIASIIKFKFYNTPSYECIILGFGSRYKQYFLALLVSPFGRIVYAPDDSYSHVVTSNLRVLREFGVDPAYDSQWKAQKRPFKRDMLLIHPGSGRGQVKKRPSPELILDVYKILVGVLNRNQVLLIFGPDEYDISQNFPDVNIVKLSTIDDVIDIISRARCLITGDTGYGHVAAYCETPIVTLGGPTNVKRTMPFTDNIELFSASDKLECVPCYGTKLFQICRDNQCMQLIDAEAVANAALIRWSQFKE